MIGQITDDRLSWKKPDVGESDRQTMGMVRTAKRKHVFTQVLSIPVVSLVRPYSFTASQLVTYQSLNLQCCCTNFGHGAVAGRIIPRAGFQSSRPHLTIQ